MIDILVTIISAILLLPIFRFARSTIRAYRAYKLLIDERAECCEDISFIGCSALCSGEYNVARLQRLLTVEYSRYELIAVVDSSKYGDEVEQIVAYFQLIRVNPIGNAGDGEPIRALYRSRQHHFQRLVLVDVHHIGLFEDLNVAMAVASFDYLLPLRYDVILASHAVETLMVAVSESEERVDMVSVASSPSSYLFSRYGVEQAGGFSEDITASRLLRHRVVVYAPIIYRYAPSKSRLLRGAIWVVAGLLLLYYLSVGGLWVVVVIMSLLSLYAVVTYQRALFFPANSLKIPLLCYFNHLVSFFYCRKFRL